MPRALPDGLRRKESSEGLNFQLACHRSCYRWYACHTVNIRAGWKSIGLAAGLNSLGIRFRPRDDGARGGVEGVYATVRIVSTMLDNVAKPHRHNLEKWLVRYSDREYHPAVLDGFNDGEIRRWLHLRAIEWTNWPAFISQPIVPILLVFFYWPYVIGGVVACDIMWAFVRYSFIGPRLLNAGSLFVGFTKWPAAIGSAGYLFFHHSYGIGILALLWPFLAMFICVPGLIGRVELSLAKSIGYVDQDVQFGV
jgi:hypothetical protein